MILSLLKSSSWLLLLVVAIPNLAVSHEGHDHDAPVFANPKKGGVIKSIGKINLELVTKGNDLRIYLYNAEMKSLSAQGFAINAKAEMPRSKKVEKVILNAKDNFFEATYDAKGIHRYTLLLELSDLKSAKKDNIEFTVEPRN